MIDIIQQYKNKLTSCDETFDAKGEVSAIWKPIFDTISKLGIKEITERQRDIQRAVIENGITYNVYGDPRGENRPWELNPLPFIISQTDWDYIEKGLIQRAELFDFILTDLYSQRNLLKDGFLPVDLILANSSFLKQSNGTLSPKKKNLTIYAADIVRSNDGKWYVINDSAQAPSGLGYTLENRMTLGQILPEFTNSFHLRKISGFYQSFNTALSELSPRRNENPRIVLLTPGPLNETYFEHSYLTTFLRYTLAQGGDLVVQNGCVWLKTMKGLKRVDVILRRVDDIYCDPLELLDYSQLGIPGLLEAIRRRNVAVVNPLGSGILESPGIQPFISDILKHFFNEDLLLKSPETYWCGRKSDLKFVLNNLHNLVVKKLQKRYITNTVFAGKISDSELRKLKYEIIKTPYLFAGQANMQFSTTPVFVDNAIEPRHSVVRCFVVYSNGKYVVLPGGLTRTSMQKDNVRVSNQLGGASQDTFIVGNKPDKIQNITVFSNESNVLPSDIGTIPSRIAENLYWTGRYAARALYTARLLRVTLKSLIEKKSLEYKESQISLEVLLKTLTQTTMSYPGFVGEGSEKLLKKPDKEVLDLILYNHKSGGLSYTLFCMKNSSEAVKNLWSTDTRRITDHIDYQWKIFQKTPIKHLRELITPLDQLITRLIAFMGLIKESVTREQGRILYDIGLRLEQSILLTSKIRSALTFKMEENIENEIIEAILVSHESLNIYRNSFRTFRIIPFIELLLLNINYPSSLAFNLDVLQKRFHSLPNKENNYRLSDFEKSILDAFTKLRLSEPIFLSEVKENNYRENLEEFLSWQSNTLFQISSDLTKKFFSHTNENQQFISQTISV